MKLLRHLLALLLLGTVFNPVVALAQGGEPSTVFSQVAGSFTWAQAKLDAVARGGRLAVVNTSQKQAQIEAAGLHGWIGLTDEITEGVFKWVDGTNLSYSNWSTSEPNNTGNADYVQIYPASYKWDDTTANISQSYILETAILSISAQPQSATVAKGSSVTLSVTASGTGSLTYQWQKDGLDLPGKTAATLSLTNVQPQHIGYYTCRVTDSNGSTTSQQATLNITGENFGIWQGLLGQYNFSGDYADSTPFNNPVTNKTDVDLGTDRFGVASRALRFSTVNAIASTERNVPVGGNASRTVAFWFKLNENPSSKSVGLGWGEAGDTSSAGQGFQFAVFSSGAVFSGASPSLVSMHGCYADTFSGQSAGFDYGKWHLFVGVYSGALASTQCFIDGVTLGPAAVSSLNARSDLNTVQTPLKLTGYHFALHSDYAQQGGLLDDVRIYNRALSAEEVLQLYQVESAAPLITTQPTANQTVAKGSSVTLSVTASGTGSLTYQWQKDGLDLPGKTAATLSLTNVQPQHIGYYTCRVTDTTGSTTSQQATLNITGENFGIWQGLVAYYPFKGNAQDATAYGNNGTVSGAAVTSDRSTIQANAYAFNGVSSYIEMGRSLPDMESLTVGLWAFIPDAAGNGVMVFEGDSTSGHDLQISYGPEDGLYFRTKGAEQFLLCPCPKNRWIHIVATADSENQKAIIWINGVNCAETTLDAVINHAYHYKFQLGRLADGVLNSVYFEGALDDVRIYNRALSAEEVGQLYQSEGVFSPEITVQPEGQAVYFNQTATFSVTATGTAPLAYQWFRDGRAIPGATSATYSFKATPAVRGAYSVRVSNALGSVTSDAVPLDAVAARYTWAAESDNQRVALGGTAGFGVQDVTGPTEAVSYQWFKDGKAVSGATSATLEFSSVTLTNAGRYTLVITTAAGKETTATRVLAVEDPGLLVYSYGATTTDADPVGELTTKQMGFFVVDRANGQAALMLYGKVGSQKVQTTEGPFPLETTSTGPVPGSRTVFHVAASTETTVDQTWFTGRDALVRLSASRSTIAPSVATGSVGRIDAGIGHSAVTLALSTGQTLATRTNGETLAEAVSRIQSELTAKGYVPAAE